MLLEVVMASLSNPIQQGLKQHWAPSIPINYPGIIVQSNTTRIETYRALPLVTSHNRHHCPIQYNKDWNIIVKYGYDLAFYGIIVQSNTTRIETHSPRMAYNRGYKEHHCPIQYNKDWNQMDQAVSRAATLASLSNPIQQGLKPAWYRGFSGNRRASLSNPIQQGLKPHGRAWFLLRAQRASLSNPIQQGLKRKAWIAGQPLGAGIIVQSNTTRIETPCSWWRPDATAQHHCPIQYNKDWNKALAQRAQASMYCIIVQSNTTRIETWVW